MEWLLKQSRGYHSHRTNICQPQMKLGIFSRTRAHKHFTSSPTYSSRLAITDAPRAASVTLFQNHIAKLKSACKECRASVIQPQYLRHVHSWLCILMEELCWQLHHEKRTITQSYGQQGHRLLPQGHLRAKLQAALNHCTHKMYRCTPIINPHKQ